MMAIMKRIRRLVFKWDEKLNILPSERFVILCLMLLLFAGTAIWILLPPYRTIYDQEDYSELHQLFLKRSREHQREYEQIAQRYRPDPAEEVKKPVQTMTAATVTPQSSKSTSRPTKASATPKQQEAEPTTANEPKPREPKSAEPIDINAANAEQLTRLPGIGPVIAARIVEYRQNNGYFIRLDQLTEVKGIGPARLRKIKTLVLLGSHK
jgi:competence ComEA-like helix-hairpin-helix protein